MAGEAGQVAAEGIFINCPADGKSLPILRALIFTARICGFIPRLAGLRDDQGSTRLEEIHRLIAECRLSVHDISAVEADPETDLPALNVPLELGMALGSMKLESSAKRALILDSDPYRHQRALSNISGLDILSHNGDPRRASRLFRDWLVQQTRRALPAPQTIWKRYRKFSYDLPSLALKVGTSAEKIALREWDNELYLWLQEEAPELDYANLTDSADEPALEAPQPASPPVSLAETIIKSSGWTGRRPLKEQIRIVLGIAPTTRQSIAQLIEIVEEKRFNDPATDEALQALRDLHTALGELIDRAESNRPMEEVFAAVEGHKGRLVSAVREGAQIMVTAPALAVGASYMLSLLSGFPVSDAMLSTLCATMMGKDALLALARKRSSGDSE